VVRGGLRDIFLLRTLVSCDIHLNYRSANQVDNDQLFFAPLEVFCCAGSHPSPCNVRTRILNANSSMIVVPGVLRGTRFGRGGCAAGAMGR
jgi:hypothetical protein